MQPQSCIVFITGIIIHGVGQIIQFLNILLYISYQLNCYSDSGSLSVVVEDRTVLVHLNALDEFV